MKLLHEATTTTMKKAVRNAKSAVTTMLLLKAYQNLPLLPFAL